jgi:hypothetical protein
VTATVKNNGTGPAWRVLLDSDAELFGGTGTVEPLAPYQCLLYEARR